MLVVLIVVLLVVLTIESRLQLTWLTLGRQISCCYEPRLESLRGAGPMAFPIQIPAGIQAAPETGKIHYIRSSHVANHNILWFRKTF